jgi:hypothetical protein
VRIFAAARDRKERRHLLSAVVAHSEETETTAVAAELLVHCRWADLYQRQRERVFPGAQGGSHVIGVESREAVSIDIADVGIPCGE